MSSFGLKHLIYGRIMATLCSNRRPFGKYRMKILVVDDEPLLLEVVKTSLSQLGYQDVTLATSGAEALVAMNNASVPFDCFLFDIQMPKMDGITLIGAVREKPAYKRTPILMLTVTSRKVVWLFLEQLGLEFVPVFHRLQGRLAAQG
ncbi:MAG: response regulator [Sediminimonas qiaohouensis]|uniref:Response regulator n=1 Tax=Sediminimonas qiaohouensis TaxID=552061 RepID=A0A7C9LLZ0_9RHOB|nr:response regulator [Sediminimonas qiaohouensis]